DTDPRTGQLTWPPPQLVALNLPDDIPEYMRTKPAEAGGATQAPESNVSGDAYGLPKSVMSILEKIYNAMDSTNKPASFDEYLGTLDPPLVPAHSMADVRANLESAKNAIDSYKTDHADDYKTGQLSPADITG